MKCDVAPSKITSRCTEVNEGIPHHRPQTRPAASHPNTVDVTFDCPTSNGRPREDTDRGALRAYDPPRHGTGPGKELCCVSLREQNGTNRTGSVENAEEDSSTTIEDVSARGRALQSHSEPRAIVSVDRSKFDEISTVTSRDTMMSYHSFW